MKVLVIGKEGRLQKNTAPEIYNQYEVVYVPAEAGDEEAIAAGGDADFILVDAMSKVSGKLISAMPNLKLIHSEGVGYQGVDIREASKKNVYVCNCKGMNATAVAEQAILLMLGVLKGFVTGDREFRKGRQIEIKENHMTTGDLKELRDCTVGLIGFGDIARETAKFVSVFGAKVVYYSRTRASEEVEQRCHAAYMPLDELLASSDLVSIHLPVTPDTKNYVNAAFLAKMKKNSYLINTARGELVDSKALLESIRNGHLAGAGLDCVAGEPVQPDNILLSAEQEVADKIIYSCHVGGITPSSFKRGYDMVWSNFARVAKGERPMNIVNGL